MLQHVFAAFETLDSIFSPLAYRDMCFSAFCTLQVINRFKVLQMGGEKRGMVSYNAPLLHYFIEKLKTLSNYGSSDHQV